MIYKTISVWLMIFLFTQVLAKIGYN